MIRCAADVAAEAAQRGDAPGSAYRVGTCFYLESP